MAVLLSTNNRLENTLLEPDLNINTSIHLCLRPVMGCCGNETKNGLKLPTAWKNQLRLIQ
jgi:hypothetical protein